MPRPGDNPSRDVLLANWSAKAKIYDFSPASGHVKYLRPRKSEEEVAGFFKALGADPIVCYVSDGNYWFWFQGRLVAMDDPNFDVSMSTRWPFVSTTIKCADRHVTFREFAPFKLMWARMDPTYDGMDFGIDFFGAYLFHRKSAAERRRNKN